MKLISKHICLIAAAIILCGAAAHAQKQFEVRKVDFEKVKSVTLNPNADFYFPKLLKAFTSNDTTMSLEAYRDLYYGYVFQEDYDPLRKSAYSEVVKDLYLINDREHTRAECDSIAKYAELSLKDNIFDLNQMDYYIFALKAKRKYALAAVRKFHLDHLIAAIMSSGRGTKEEPWVVISPEHEYFIANKLGYKIVKNESIDDDLEYCTLTPIDTKTNKKLDNDGIYFDVSRILITYREKYPE